MKALTLSVPMETDAQREMLRLLRLYVVEITGGATEWYAGGIWHGGDRVYDERVVVMHITGLAQQTVEKILRKFRGLAWQAGERAIWFELRDDCAVVEALTEAKDATG